MILIMIVVITGTAGIKHNLYRVNNTNKKITENSYIKFISIISVNNSNSICNNNANSNRGSKVNTS